jgi:hypothetical protein
MLVPWSQLSIQNNVDSPLPKFDTVAARKKSTTPAHQSQAAPAKSAVDQSGEATASAPKGLPLSAGGLPPPDHQSRVAYKQSPKQPNGHRKSMRQGENLALGRLIRIGLLRLISIMEGVQGNQFLRHLCSIG